LELWNRRKQTMKIKELTKKPNLLAKGHRACAGCSEPIAVRMILRASEHPVVVCNPTGCLEVTTTIYPFTAWNTPYIHSAFENAAATISGVETAYRALKKRGKMPKDGRINFVAIGGDGGTYDIGFQSLSGALERGHRMVYVCLNNEAYMNTGIQRSSATPFGAHTTTSPAGKVIPGKQQQRKDLTQCVAAHNIPYVAQAIPSHWRDLVSKAKKAFEADGPAFLNIFAPCRLGWGFPPEDAIDICREAVETRYWPLYEVENGKWTLNYQPKEKRPIEGWLKRQQRFRHLFRDENRWVVEELQRKIDEDWERLKKRCGVD
jgi:pyruvate ferredoxin oxidoreductase beta subunit